MVRPLQVGNTCPQHLELARAEETISWETVLVDSLPITPGTIARRVVRTGFLLVNSTVRSDGENAHFPAQNDTLHCPAKRVFGFECDTDRCKLEQRS